MTAPATRFAIVGRSVPHSTYEALHSGAHPPKIVRRTNRPQIAGRWTGATDILEPPARFAA